MPRWKKKVNIIKYFIEHGADINKKKKKKKKRRSGDTPLGYLMSKRK